MPIAPLALVLIGPNDCANAMRDVGLDDWRIAREQRFAAAEPAPIAALREQRLLLAQRKLPVLCTLTRDRPAPAV